MPGLRSLGPRMFRPWRFFAQIQACAAKGEPTLARPRQAVPQSRLQCATLHVMKIGHRRGLASCATALLTMGALACDRQSATPDESPAVKAKPEAASVEAPLASNSELGREVIAAMDPATDPCQNFYRYACGGWLDATPMPDDKPSYGRGFTQVRDRNAQSLEGLLASAAQASGELGMAGRFYAACMDENRVEADAPAGLEAALEGIEAVRDLRGLARYLGRAHGRRVGSAVFSAGLSNDFKDPDRYILALSQGGLGLPDRSYYLEEARKPLLDYYRGYVADMLGYAGVAESERSQRAEAVVEFEIALAKIALPRDELRDPEKVYNRRTRRELAAQSAGFAWKTYFKALGIADVDAINVAVPGFIEGFPAVLRATPIAVVRDYLRAHAVDHAAPHLSEAIVATNFGLQQKMRGAKKIRARWERCVGMTTGAFPDVVAKSYVEEFFAGESRETALSMIHDIESAFSAALPKLAWMDDTTRERALTKMKAIGNKIGYPNRWRSYAGLDAGPGHFTNVSAATAFEWQRDLAKIGTRVDPEEWQIPASMVNAFYNPLQNEMMFPAGILQPPFFSEKFPRAMNYGGIGMAMGHELTHGFDDSGRKFDGDGIMQQWWKEAASERFEARAQCIEKAYSAVEVQPGVAINGKLTLGENIADFGGMKLTAAAYRSYVESNGPEDQLIEGLSNEQLLFVAFGQAWCTKASPEYARWMVTVDPHSPPEQRVNLTLSHLPAFREAFECAPDTAMNVADSCEVW